MNFHGGDIYSLQNRVLDFSANINPYGIPESFREALIAGMDELTRYPDIKYRALKAAIAEYLQLESPDFVIPGNGAVEIIFRTIAALGSQRMINVSPTFSEYARAARHSGLEVADINAYQNDFQQIDFSVLYDALQPGSLVVICNPNNPTGTFVAREKMEEVAGELAKKGCFLIIDEAFIEFTADYPENSMVGSLDQFDNLLIVRAATKFFGMPGIRLGFGITKNIDLLNKIESIMEPWNVNGAAVIAGCTVYRDQEYIEASRNWAYQERTYLFEQLNELPGIKVYPSQVNYHLVRLVGEKMDAWQLKEEMLKKGVLIRTPDGFNYMTPYHFRLAVRNREENELMVQALREVLTANGV